MRNLLFVDDAALLTHSEKGLQRLINYFAYAFEELGLTISLNKTKVMGQVVSNAPEIRIEGHTLEVVNEFSYLGSTISKNLSLDSEISKRIAKAVT